MIDTDIKPKMTINLSMREMLPKVREAFDNKTLQMFSSPTTEFVLVIVGSYKGPCAIGVCMTPEQQEYGDDNEFGEYSVDALARLGVFVFASEKELLDAVILQHAHDVCLKSGHREYELAHFSTTLSQFEKEYGVTQS